MWEGRHLSEGAAAYASQLDAVAEEPDEASPQLSPDQMALILQQLDAVRSLSCQHQLLAAGLSCIPMLHDAAIAAHGKCSDILAMEAGHVSLIGRSWVKLDMQVDPEQTGRMDYRALRLFLDAAGLHPSTTDVRHIMRELDPARQAAVPGQSNPKIHTCVHAVEKPSHALQSAKVWSVGIRCHAMLYLCCPCHTTGAIEPQNQMPDCCIHYMLKPICTARPGSFRAVMTQDCGPMAPKSGDGPFCPCAGLALSHVRCSSPTSVTAADTHPQPQLSQRAEAQQTIAAGSETQAGLCTGLALSHARLSSPTSVTPADTHPQPQLSQRTEARQTIAAGSGTQAGLCAGLALSRVKPSLPTSVTAADTHPQPQLSQRAEARQTLMLALRAQMRRASRMKQRTPVS